MMAIKYKIDECGIFRDEIKNRFRSIVTINNQDVMCYIESSSRLDNYINLKDKKIFLQKINNKSLKYKVFMLPYRYDKILLCPMMANKIVASEFDRKIFSSIGIRNKFQTEYLIEGYKSDLYIPKTKTIIEIKAVLTNNKSALFPSVFSERSLYQLKEISILLDKGYKAHYIFVSLNPYTDSIKIDTNTKFYNELYKCINKGLTLSAYSITCKNNEICIKKRINIKIF